VNRKDVGTGIALSRERDGFSRETASCSTFWKFVISGLVFLSGLLHPASGSDGEVPSLRRTRGSTPGGYGGIHPSWNSPAASGYNFSHPLRPIVQSVSFSNNVGLATPVFRRRNLADVARTPIPYWTLRVKLIDEASSKYRVGQLISPIRNPK
jgi:hypothetical protein